MGAFSDATRMPTVGKVLPIVRDSSSANVNNNTPQAPSEARTLEVLIHVKMLVPDNQFKRMMEKVHDFYFLTGVHT